MTEAMNLFEKQSYDLVDYLMILDMSYYSKCLLLNHNRLPGYGIPQDIEKSFSVGFKKHLIKPVTLAILKTAILDVVSSCFLVT